MQTFKPSSFLRNLHLGICRLTKSSPGKKTANFFTSWMKILQQVWLNHGYSTGLKLGLLTRTLMASSAPVEGEAVNSSFFWPPVIAWHSSTVIITQKAASYWKTERSFQSLCLFFELWISFWPLTSLMVQLLAAFLPFALLLLML